MSKLLLMIVGVGLIVMGLWAAVPSLAVGGAVMPLWHALVTIVVGVVCVAVSAQEKK